MVAPSLRALLAAALGPLLGWSCAITFPCNTDEQCARDGATGVCQASGYCSFPDANCESNQRYGDLAPGSLAGTCVRLDEGTGSATATTGDDATDGASTMGAVSTIGVDGPLTTEGTDDPSSSDTGDPICCHAGCEGTCDSACAPEQIGGPVEQEAIGVAVVGDFVVWSTGYGRSLELSSVASGSRGQLAMVRGNSFVTKIAADDTHVYFVDYGGPTVKRASVPEGVIDVVTTIDGGMANFGGIAVGADHVYFAMRGSGDVWRAAKDLSDQDTAQLVASAASPYDVALDDTHVYWVDDIEQRISSLAFGDIDTGRAPEIVYQGTGLGTLTVDATHVYFSDDDSIGRAVKSGQDEGIETLAAEQGAIWDIAVDETHVYWTSASKEKLARVPLTGGEVETLADTPTPWGLDLGCQAAFWAENGTQTLQMVRK